MSKPSIESFEKIDLDDHPTPGMLIYFDDGTCITATLPEARRLYEIEC